MDVGMASFNTYATGAITALPLTSLGFVQISLGSLVVMLSPTEAQALSVELAAAAVELGQPVILTGNADLERAA